MNPWAMPVVHPMPERARLPNGLYVWTPETDSCDYWARPLYISERQAEYLRRHLEASPRKDRE